MKKNKAFIFLLCSFFLIIIFLIVIYFLASTSNEKEEANEYQYIQLNTKTNETYLGYIYVPFPMLLDDSEKNHFQYYQNENEHFLVSEFGSDEYQCSGYCTCEEETYDESRRSSTGASLGRGLFYLLAATSSLLAVQIAKDHFLNQCTETFSDYCEEDSIVSEVEECVPILSETYEEDDEGGLIVIDPPSFDELEERAQKRKIKKKKKTKRKKRKKKQTIDDMIDSTEEEGVDYRSEWAESYDEAYEYFCSGKCVLRDHWRGLLKKYKWEYDKIEYLSPRLDPDLTNHLGYIRLREAACERMKMTMVINVGRDYYYDAQIKFRDKHLVPFCKENSEIPYNPDKTQVNSWCYADTKYYVEHLYKIKNRYGSIWCEAADEVKSKDYWKKGGTGKKRKKYKKRWLGGGGSSYGERKKYAPREPEPEIHWRKKLEELGF